MRTDLRTLRPGRPAGRIAAPASKSHGIRLVAAAALAEGESLLRAPPACRDFAAAVGIAEGLGATAERTGAGLAVQGRGGAPLRAPVSLDCAESALCLRLFTCVAAALCRDGAARATLLGHGSLRSRPLGGIRPVLGASCETASGHPPVTARAGLTPGPFVLDATDSSQGLSGLLMALPLLAGPSTIELTGLVSRRYVQLTLAVLDAAGIRCDADPALTHFAIPAPQRYRPLEAQVEGDWSGASFPLVAGALAGPVTVTGLDLTSEQPDRAVLSALEAAGAVVEAHAEHVTVRSGTARAFSFDLTDCPDLAPPLAVLASACPGTSTLLGAQRLRAKESDRAEVLRRELGAMGVPVVVESDRLLITGAPAHAASLDAHGDHRIAMAMAVAALRASGPCELEGASSVDKSYPGFFDDLAYLRGGAA